MAVSFDRVPPVWSQTSFNAFLAEVEGFINGFTPSGNFLNPYTYLIYKSGSDWYADNAYTTVYGGDADAGGVDGADCLAVMEAARDDLTSGGNIQFKGATDYEIDGTFELLSSSIHLFGEAGARIVDTSGGTDPAIKIGNYPTVGLVNDCGVHNLRILKEAGNEGTGDILELDGTEYCRFDNTWLYNGMGRALYLNGDNYFNEFRGTYINAVPKGIEIVSPTTTPVNNINWFYATLIALGNASADAEFGVVNKYSNGNCFYGIDIEPRASYTPKPNVAMQIYGCRGTLVSGFICGENNFYKGIEVTGDSDYFSKSTTLVNPTVANCELGVYVDYAEATRVLGVRGSSILTFLVALSANHLNTTLLGLNLNTGTNYYTDSAPTETTWLDSNQKTKRMFFTFDVAANQTNKQIAYVGTNLLTKDMYFSKLMSTAITVPGGGETLSINLTDGTNNMTTSHGAADVDASTTTGAYTFDVSGKVMLLRYTSSAGCATGLCTVAIEYEEVWT